MLPEFGGVEVLAIAALALIIVGPKDLPVLLRKVGQFIGKMRGMANEFRASFDEMARQSELDELRKEVEAMRLAQTYDPTGTVPGAFGPQAGYEGFGRADDASLPVSHAAEPANPWEPSPEIGFAEPAKPARTARKTAKPATTKKAKPKTATKATPKPKPAVTAAAKPPGRPKAAAARPSKTTPAKARPRPRTKAPAETPR